MLRNAGAAPRSTHCTDFNIETCIWVGAIKSCLVHTGPHPIIHLWVSLETEATTVDLSKLRLSSTQLHGLLILVVDLLLQVHVWFDMV
jgi:hypothetical protein